MKEKNSVPELQTSTVRKAKASVPRKQRPIRFLAKYLNCTVIYNAVDEEGKPRYRTNLTTGQPIFDTNGEKVPIEKSLKFTAREVRFAKGYLSEYVWDPTDKTPDNVERGKALKRMAEKRDAKIYYEDDYYKEVNPQMYAERKAKLALEEKVAEADALANDPAALKKRLSELEGK